MNYAFAIKWLKAFRTSPEEVCALYADDFLFEDLMLDQSITDKDDLHRVFAPYANKDPDNGIGIHNTAERLKTLYAAKHKFVLQWPEAGGCEVTVDLPFRKSAQQEVSSCER